MVNIFWFRRDLRLEDNTALFFALKQNLPVLPLFIFDDNILSELPENDARVSFIYQQIEDLQKQFQKLNASVLILHGNPQKIWEKLPSQYSIRDVYMNEDYEPYARERDAAIEKLLNKKGISLHRYKDHVIFGTSDILKSNGEPYTVFTPYKNKWLAKFKQREVEKMKSAEPNNYLQINLNLPSLHEIGFRYSELKVKPFQINQLSDYEKTRNFPAEDSTSYLSPHLRFGTVSIREIIRKIGLHNQVFLSELIWREFFMQILWHYPEVVTKNFRSKYNGIEWRNNQEDFERWTRGETGYPMVDAGMRQLNQTGYMHNRVRMVTASFLCKHLLIDWRWGEAYFAEKLLDYELSSNNGNWQWAAGTGCDAAPYFRIFNPAEQEKKFDKDRQYIKKWLPEFDTPSYPKPIVDHSFARNRALKVYKAGIKT